MLFPEVTHGNLGPHPPSAPSQLPADLYNDVRAFLSESQKVDAAAIDSFVEAAVSNYLIRRASKLVHAATQHLSEDELADFVSESMEWARLQK